MSALSPRSEASLRGLGAAAVVLVSACWLVMPAPARAGWEDARAINPAPDALSSSERAGDVAVGANGLATALFFQNARNEAFLTRRSASAPGWGTAVGVAFAGEATGSPFRAELAANAAGDAIGVFNLPGNPGRVQAVSWPAGAAQPGPAVEVLRGNGDVAVALDAAGNGYVVVSTGTEVRFARYDAATATWSAPETIGQGASPELAVNRAGEIAVSYTRFVATPEPGAARLFARRRAPGASSFSAERQVDVADGQDVTGHDIAIDEQGAATVAFTQQLAAPDLPVFTRAIARRWPRDADPRDAELLSSPRPVYRPASDPAVVVDPRGRVTAAWREMEDGTFSRYRLYSAERIDDRGFGFRQSVSPTSEHFSDDESSQPPDEPSPDNERTVTPSGAPYELAVDADGTATAVYSESIGALGLVDPDVKASRRAAGGRWSPLTSLRSDAADAGAVNAFFKPAVAAARGGQVDAVFVQDVGGRRSLMATRFEGPPPPNAEHQTMVRSFDGTLILAHWCPAAGLKAGERAPTIVAGSGWGIPGRRCAPGNSPEEEAEGVFGNTSVETLTRAGYNVLTFDARGFWRSGGTAMIDSPDVEGRDGQALIDYVASQPDAALDAEGDPRVGMLGGSYGGGIQFVTAARDRRVDAIAPAIAWNSLVTSLFPRETVKAGWASILVGAGIPMTTLPGVLSPAGIETGNLAPEVYDAAATGTASGTARPATRQWFAERGPHSVVQRVRAPTLLLQGTVDTLFTLDEAHRNFEALRAAGTEVKMVWFCGGHGVCPRQGADQEHVDRRVLSWFDRHLRGRDVATGPLFEWVDEDGGWHESASYPPPADDALRGSGSGTLSLTPGELPGSGVVVMATPFSTGSSHPANVEVPIRAPAEGWTLVGAPQLRLAYTATGQSTYGTGVEGAAQQRTYVYAQVVDNARRMVVGNQATPIPIALDGQRHEFSLPLERIASRALPAGYSLQIVPQTSVYDGQRAAGVVDFHAIDVALPLDLPGGGVDGVAKAAGGVAPTASPASRAPRRTRARHRCGGRRATIVGTRRDDVLTGTRQRDVIVGLAGDDTIRGLGGNDLVCAGAGNDRVTAGAGHDIVHGGAGKDELRGDAGRDRLFGGTGHDRVFGGPGRDRLFGGAGHDRVYGGPGEDRLSGGAGHDRLFGGPGGDRLFGGTGRNQLFGGAGRDVLLGRPDDRLYGGAGRDRVIRASRARRRAP